MRHPFLKWTGWLSIGLSGCLHGQDWRAAVTKPTTRTVADRRESRPQPKVVGPFRAGQPKFVPSAENTTTPMMAARPKETNSTSQLPQEVTLPPAVKPEPQTRDQQITLVGHEAPKTTPSVSASKIVEPPRTGAFAEFERTIPLRSSDDANSSVSHPEPDDEIVVEKRETEDATALPIITPAGALLSAKPVTVQGLNTRSLEPEASSEDEQPRGLFSKSAVLAKEIPDVTDATDATANDSSSASSETVTRPQDVSVLVEQVFEDLRQRRMDDARKRTEWLKHLVKKRASASPSNAVAEESPAATEASHFNEPRRLDVDPQATAVKKVVSETFFDDEESTSSK